MGAAVAAIVMRREREIVDAMRAVGATSASSARTLDEAGINENVGFSRLRSGEVLRDAGGGRYYLDELGWTALRRTRRRVAAILLVIIAFALASGWLTLR